MLERVLENLATAGPVALVLGFVCWKLWEQNQLLMTKIETQHGKMLRLAVRVQRAVEALAGLETPAVEKDLDEADQEKT